MHSLIARKTWRTLEPIHGAVYFVPEGPETYATLGLAARQGYFASRAAPLGAVPAEVVQATFYNFAPAVVAGAIPSAWAVATPSAIVEARLRVADAYLRRILGDALGESDVAEAAALARRAAEAATQWSEGRPLFAAHAALAWPDDAHLALWHAQTLLREFRGDGHIAALTVEGVSGCEALVLHGATGEVAPAVLQASRAWSDNDWAAAVDRLRGRGWLDASGGLTDAGRAHRRWVEDRTDALAVGAYDAIGEDGCDRLRALGRPLSKAIVASGSFGFPPS